MNRTEFIQQYAPLVTKLGKAVGIYPEIVFSQAFAEGTGKVNGQYVFGESPTMKNANNIFNIRPGGQKPNEYWDGSTYDNPYVTTESKTFRAYKSLEDSIADYFNFLVKNKRYRDAGVFSAPNWQAQADALDAAHFAGAANGGYAKLLKSIGTSVENTLSKLKDYIKTEVDAGVKVVETESKKVASAASTHATTILITLIGLALTYELIKSQSKRQQNKPGNDGNREQQQ